MSGQVKTTEGTVVQNATIRALGIDFQNISGANPAELRDRANAIVDNATDVVPEDFWQPDLSLTGSDSLMGGANSRYVSVYDKDEWRGNTPNMENPQLSVEANDPTVMFVWDPSDTGFVQDGIDSQLPGAVTNEGPIIAEQIGPTGDIIDETRFQLRETYSTYSGLASDKQFAQVALNPGFYRVYPEGSPETAYTIVAGDPQSIVSGFETQLRNKAGQLSNRAEWIQQQVQNNKFDVKTTSTDANGRWSLNVSQQTKLVGVSAYKGPIDQLGKDPRNVTMEDIRTLYETTTLNQSLYMPTGIQRVSPPKSDVRVEVREASVPTFGNMSRFNDLFDKLRDRFLNETLGEYSDLFQQPNATRERLEELSQNLTELARQNERLERYVLNNDFGLDESDLQDLNLSDLTDGELRTRVGAIEEAITSLRNTIDTNTSSSVGAEAVSSIATFQTALNASQVEVLAHYSNGTTTTVPDDYLTVSQSTGTMVGLGQTEVQVNDFPLGDASSVEFEWVAASPDGVASTTERVTNPLVNADPPGVESVTVSSLAPGPNDPVQVELNPADDSRFRNLTDVTVYGPAGNSITPGAIQNGKRVNFTTAGDGRHTVQLTYADIDGNTWTRTVTIGAASVDRNRPASLKASSGPTGIYALAADGLDGGAVSKQGTTIAMEAAVSQQADVPGTIHTYTQEIADSPTGTYALAVQRSDGKSVSTRSEIIMHTQAAPADGTYVYRNGVPVTTEGTQAGTVSYKSNQTLIQTYTDETGQVSVTVVQPQGIIDSTWQRARWEVAQLQLAVSGLTSSIGGLDISLGILLVVIPAGAMGARRRGRGGNGGATA